MKKRYILKNKRDFNRIIDSCNPIKYKDFVIYIERTDDLIYHFGFSVGKKIGNAVTRNKIRRQLKNIVDKKDYQNGFNCIIIVGRGVLEKNFDELKNNLFHVLDSLNIYNKEDLDEKKQ